MSDPKAGLPAKAGLHPEDAADNPPSDAAVELPDSQVEPGGPPVRVDPSMVTPEGAERMRPSDDPRHR
jgi:hypothetical protein